MLQVLMQTSKETAFLMSLQSVLSLFLSLLKFSCNFFMWNALSRSADLLTLACCICFLGTHTRPGFSRKSSLSWKLVDGECVLLQQDTPAFTPFYYRHSSVAVGSTSM